MRLYELKKGEIFKFTDPAISIGRLTVFSCWGVRSKEKMPLDPWFLVCHDEYRQSHCFILPANTEIKFHSVGS